jgi:hypothetical protein
LNLICRVILIDEERAMVKKREIPTTPAGKQKSTKTALLETGADLLQDLTPINDCKGF